MSTASPSVLRLTKGMSLFAFEDVAVTREGTAVLSSITLDLPEDGITAIVGPSGAGKSTLLRLCNRLDVPTSGRVSYRGVDLAELDPMELRRDVGMVFQRPALFGGTVGENLAVADPGSSHRDRVAALELAALSAGFLDRRADSLSGGEAQRLCLARTLLTEPETLLLDEPTSALDAGPKEAFEATALELTEDGMQVLWVTHEQAQVERIAQRVVAMEDGRVTGVTDAKR